MQIKYTNPVYTILLAKCQVNFRLEKIIIFQAITFVNFQITCYWALVLFQIEFHFFGLFWA